MSIALYEKCLAAADWYSDYSDDYTVYRKGREELAQLQRMQKLYDTDFTLWNHCAPEEFKKIIKKGNFEMNIEKGLDT
jgi:hypothetical protein